MDVYHRALWDDRLVGPVNAVAPQRVRNNEYTKALAGVLHRPALLPIHNQLFNRGGKARSIAGVHQHPGDSFPQVLFHPTGVGGHYRHPGGKCLQCDKTERLCG